MRSAARLLVPLCIALLIVLSLLPKLPSAQAHPQIGPLDLAGEINGAPYHIQVPANWNGTLLVFARGYRDKADHPGEIDNRSADLAPSPALVPPLLAQGYALAGSAFKDNGWSIGDGTQDVKDLAVYFRENVAKPEHTILWAISFGAFVGLKSMEQFGGIYDGALCMCGEGSGATRIWDSGVPGFLAYDVIFGIPNSWGTVGEVRNDLDFETEVQPKLVAEVSNPANFPKFEFIRLVGGIPGQGIVPPAPPNFYPGWVFTDFFFLTEVRAELQRRAGGPVVQNLDQNYSLTLSEKAYLAALGLPGAVVDGWLAQMNARRNIQALPSARNYLSHNTDYNGKIRHPVLTVHTIVDGLVVAANEAAYAELNAAAGKQDLLFQTYTTGSGHCNFTGPQVLTAVTAIDFWVRTGIRPTAALFPVALGFDSNFAPPPMPQP
jgi:hypothetical protein